MCRRRAPHEETARKEGDAGDDSTPGFPQDFGPVIFFDGVCGLCNWGVSSLLRIDKGHVFKFAPLQGETARKRLQIEPQNMESVILSLNGRLYFRSDAVLRSLAPLGRLWRIPMVILAVPRSLRDIVYDFIARHRYRWFGKREVCCLPTPEERLYFLP